MPGSRNHSIANRANERPNRKLRNTGSNDNNPSYRPPSRSAKREAKKVTESYTLQLKMIAQIGFSVSAPKKVPRNLQTIILIALGIWAISSLSSASAKGLSQEPEHRFEPYNPTKTDNKLIAYSPYTSQDGYYYSCADTLIRYEVYNYPWSASVSYCTNEFLKLREEVLNLGNYLGFGKLLAAHRVGVSPSEFLVMADQFLRVEVAKEQPTFSNNHPLLWITTAIQSSYPKMSTPDQRAVEELYQPLMEELHKKYSVYAIPSTLDNLGAKWGTLEYYKHALTYSSLLSLKDTPHELKLDICSAAAAGKEIYSHHLYTEEKTKDPHFTLSNLFPARFSGYSIDLCAARYRDFYEFALKEKTISAKPHAYLGLFAHFNQLIKVGLANPIPGKIFNEELFVNMASFILKKWMNYELGSTERNFIDNKFIDYIENYLLRNRKFFKRNNVDLSVLGNEFRKLKAKYSNEPDNSNYFSIPLLAGLFTYCAVSIYFFKKYGYMYFTKDDLPKVIPKEIVAKVVPPPKSKKTIVKPSEEPNTPPNYLKEAKHLVKTIDDNLQEISVYLEKKTFGNEDLIRKQQYLIENQRLLNDLKGTITDRTKSDSQLEIHISETEMDNFLSQFRKCFITRDYFNQFDECQQKSEINVARLLKEAGYLVVTIDANLLEISIYIGKNTFGNEALIKKQVALKENQQLLTDLKNTLTTIIENKIGISEAQIIAFHTQFKGSEIKRDYFNDFDKCQTRAAKLYKDECAKTFARNQASWQQQQKRIIEKTSTEISPQRLPKNDSVSTSPASPVSTNSTSPAIASSSSSNNKRYAGSFFSLASALPELIKTPDLIYLTTARDALESMHLLSNEVEAESVDKVRLGLMYNLMRFHHVIWRMQADDRSLKLPIDKEGAHTIRNMIRHGYFLNDYDQLLIPYAKALCETFHKSIISMIDQKTKVRFPRLDYQGEKPFSIERNQVIEDYQNDPLAISQNIIQNLETLAILFESRNKEITFFNDAPLHAALKMLINNIGENLKSLQRKHYPVYKRLEDRWKKLLDKDQLDILLETKKYSNQIGHHFDEEGEASRQLEACPSRMQDEPGGRNLYTYEEITPTVIENIAKIACLLTDGDNLSLNIARSP